MSKLLVGTAVAALACAGLTACATPQYPISAEDAQPHAPMAMARPQYPIDASEPAPSQTRAPAAAPAPRAAPAPAAAPDEQPTSDTAPVGNVESQPLPPPGPSASADGARLQYASLSTQADAAAAAAQPATMPAAAPASAPVAAPSSAPVSDADTAMTPRQVIHDQPGAAPAPSSPPSAPYVARQSATLPPVAGGGSGDLFITGPVVSATGDVYENYEVQRGDHIDELARNFSTTRDVLVDANHIRAPYVLRPGQIVKVPVAKAYVARTGDTLVGVAHRFSVSPSELAQLNHVAERDVLRAGQQIGLPSSMRDRGPQQLIGATAPTPKPRRPGRAPTRPRMAT